MVLSRVSPEQEDGDPICRALKAAAPGVWWRAWTGDPLQFVQLGSKKISTHDQKPRWKKTGPKTGREKTESDEKRPVVRRKTRVQKKTKIWEKKGAYGRKYVRPYGSGRK